MDVQEAFAEVIRVLHVVSVMDVGGMESFIMNMYRHIDRNQIQFDFLVHHKRRGVFEDEIEELGGHVYHTSLMDDLDFFRYKQALKKLYSENDHRIVHGHLGSTAFWYLGEAEKQGVPWRILHSHCPSRIHTLKGSIKDVLFRFSPAHANVRLACSENAGTYQFRNQDFEIIPNGIDIRRFAFNAVTREQMRAQLGLTGKFVIGHVGRFYHEKNHAYMLRMFATVRKSIPDAELMLVGAGSLMNDIMRLADELGLHDCVHFMGLQTDTAPYYQAMDVFILPSVYEAMPLTAIEAQAAGLSCILSEGVSKQAALAPDVYFLKADEDSIPAWARELSDIKENCKPDRTQLPEEIYSYDVEKVAQNMVERYMKFLEKHP